MAIISELMEFLCPGVLKGFSERKVDAKAFVAGSDKVLISAWSIMPIQVKGRLGTMTTISPL